MHDVWVACGLVFVIEGILYSLFPQQMKQALLRLVAMPATQIRVLGIASLSLGWLVVWFFSH